MADDKKPKIDLKARLGKKSVAGPSAGGAVPPPMGIPKPSGVPMPAFGKEEKKKKPKVDHSDPYSAVAADDVGGKALEPQAIKIEMSEEVVKAQKAGRIKILVGAVLAAAVGIGLGYTIGGRVKANEGAMVAVVGAKDLAKEIETANTQAEQLNEIVTRVQKALGDNKYPAKEVAEFGAVRIEFDGTKLIGRGTDRFKASTMMSLLTFASKAQEANDQKEKLQRLLAGTKKALLEHFVQSDKKKAKVKWGVIVLGGKHGPIGEMQILPAPFVMESDKKIKKIDPKTKKEKEVDYEYPEEFEINYSGKKMKLKRYAKGSATRKIVPIDPMTHGRVCANDVQMVLGKALTEMSLIMAGKKAGSPNEDDKPGLISTGEKLVTELKQIGAAAAE